MKNSYLFANEWKEESLVCVSYSYNMEEPWASRSSKSTDIKKMSGDLEDLGVDVDLVGVGSQEYEDQHTTKWLVPVREVDEQQVRRSFDPDTVGQSVVPSPVRGIKFLLKIGSFVGVFPADMGERYIHFGFEICDVMTWFHIFVIILWLVAGLIT